MVKTRTTGSDSTSARRAGGGPRNPGLPLDPEWVRKVRIARGAVARRVATLADPGGVERERRTASLLRILSCIDLTSLAGDDTPARIRRLCAKARRPLREETLERLGAVERAPTVAAVCVHPVFVPLAVESLAGSGIPVAAVSAGFPAGLSPLETRLREIEISVEAGAREIDAVIARHHVLTDDWEALYREVHGFREACGRARLKVILATGELGTLRAVHRASLVVMMAGADFVKTSTGMEAVNATLPAGLTIAGAIRAYRERTGVRIGIKPAGGIRTAEEALRWLALVEEALGEEWLDPALFRFGASSLLEDVERELGG